ncbi:MAG: sigma-54-dependent Fis family transcriptional regulator [Gammaproteobacteria bacterium]|nr:sigma-54-dependent Fis family transcriptional regulator [Gammaproteobacteria bacterium]
MACSTENLRASFTDDGRGIDDDGKTGSGKRLSSVLIVDDEPGILHALQKGLAPDFSLIEVAASTDAADALLERCHFDLIISDIRLPDRSGVDWITELREQDQATPVIFMTAHADLQTAITALRAGASDFILKPFRMEQMQTAVSRCLERRRLHKENFLLRRQVKHLNESGGIIGSCDLIRGVCEVIKRVAPMPSTVLVSGESGTGKELAARALHDYSGRSGSFVPINCGAIHADLLESELFGHAKGAFTGAVKARDGLFSYADGGTLFLDEIGEMPLAMQTRLLRVMEDRAIRPVGGNRETPVDVRIIAATNRDLRDEVEKGNFREDLFYRLNVLSIRMPALRERIQDLPQLVEHFAASIASDLGVAVPAIDQAELDRLTRYDWPGNIRELKNVIERCLLLSHKPSQSLPGCSAALVAADRLEPNDDDLLLESVERRHILRVLEMQDGNKSAAARILGVSRKTLERKCQAWGVG